MAKFFQKLKKIVQRVGIFASKTHATVVNIPNTRFYKKSRRIAHQSVSALNGAIGDSLHTTPLGIGMGFYAHEQALLIDKESLTVHFATQPATPKIALLIHGLTHNETAWDMADQTNYGLLLQKDFGYTPLFCAIIRVCIFRITAKCSPICSRLWCNRIPQISKKFVWWRIVWAA